MMTQEPPVAPIKSRKSPALMGGLIGLVAVLALIGYFGYGIVMTPSKPILATASARDITNYISNPRGLRSLARVEQQKFLDQWKETLLEKPDRKDELKAHFNKMSEVDREKFADGIFDPMKRSFVDDAKVYARTPSAERYKFLREKFQLYMQEALFLKDAAGAFGTKFTKSPDEQWEWISDHTTAEDRAICEPYVAALQDIREQVRKEQRNTTTQPVTAPG